MKVAVVGSRTTVIDISSYIPNGTTEIISGGADGIDTVAEKYADKHRLSKHIIRPQYNKYKRNAPAVRNKKIVEESDFVIAFWDGKSKGTKNAIDYAKKIGKKVEIIIIENN